MKIKIICTWLLVLVVTFAYVFAQKPVPVVASSSATPEDEIFYDEEGNRLYLNTIVTETTQTAIVTNEAGEEIANASINTEENIAYLDGKLLSPEEFMEIKTLAYKDPGQTIDLYEPFGVKYSYAGTRKGSIWLAKAGVIAIATFIVAMSPGTTWYAAWAAATAVAGMSNNAYYKMHIYYGYSGSYIYVKRVTTFYKDSARTQKLYGPMTSYQKKGRYY